MAAKKKKRREFPPLNFTDRVYRPYALALGQLAMSWNSFHEVLGSLFGAMLRGESIERMDAIWHSSNFDRPKREMLKAAIKTCSSEDLKHWPFLESDLLWMLKESDILEDARNTAIHSPILSYIRDGFDEPIVFPHIHHKNPRALRLAQKDLLTEFRWCRDSCVALRDFADAALAAIASHRAGFEQEWPWPKRPSLPNRGQKRTRQARQRRARQE